MLPPGRWGAVQARLPRSYHRLEITRAYTTSTLAFGALLELMFLRPTTAAQTPFGSGVETVPKAANLAMIPDSAFGVCSRNICPHEHRCNRDLPTRELGARGAETSQPQHTDKTAAIKRLRATNERRADGASGATVSLGQGDRQR